MVAVVNRRDYECSINISVPTEFQPEKLTVCEMNIGVYLYIYIYTSQLDKITIFNSHYVISDKEITRNLQILFGITSSASNTYWSPSKKHL